MMESLAESLRQAIASLRMEGLDLTAAEIADLERIVRGEVTIEQSRTEIMARIERLRIERPELFAGTPDK